MTMRIMASMAALALAAGAMPAQAQKAEAARPGPVASMLLGICLPWIAGVAPQKMVETLEPKGLKARWVGTRLAGFDIPPRPEFVYSGIILGEGGAWCQVSLSYNETQVNSIAAEIDAVSGGIPGYFRLTPVPPAKDQYGNLPDHAWTARGATLTVSEKPSDFPGSTGRDATLYLEKKR